MPQHAERDEDIEDLLAAFDRLRDPGDPVLAWDEVRHELLGEDRARRGATEFTHLACWCFIACPKSVAPAPEPGPSLGFRNCFGGRSRSSPAAAASGVRDGLPPSSV